MNFLLTEEHKFVIELLENSEKNLVVFGRAGTGKSTLLKHFVHNTDKNVVVLAPTGVAALNAGGQTIHSFFYFKPSVTPEDVSLVTDEYPNLYSSLDVIVIDEISMVRADLLDAVDRFLRLHCRCNEPFGGKRMIFFGDLYQLPPVLKRSEKDSFYLMYDSPYFFSANVMKEAVFEYVELKRVFRQQDEDFVKILDAIRYGQVDDEILDKLNSRYLPDFEPDDNYVYLAGKKSIVNKINEVKLKVLSGKEYILQGYVSGEFSEESFPTDGVLRLKKNARVILLNNDSLGRWVNGSMGRVVFVDTAEKVVGVELENGRVVEVEPHVWDIYRYVYDRRTKRVETVKVGSFEQFPLKLAWAITIHKSQGLTFDKVVLDIRGGLFAPGQLYVALSRCRSLEGLVLKEKVKKKHIFLDWKVVNFLKRLNRGKSGVLNVNEKIRIIEDSIKHGKKLKIFYIKGNGEEIERVVIPKELKDMEYGGRKFKALIAQTDSSDVVRNYNVKRIYDVEVLE